MTAFETELFGKYYLIHRIAVGGMAEVFLARTFAEGGFEGLFVVKCILARLGEDPGFVEMFAAEARLCVSLQHPNVVRVFDFGRIGPHWYIAMEAVSGRDFRRVLASGVHAGDRLPHALAAWVVAEASRGLHYAHTRTDAAGEPLGIVHRDVSPSNLLVSWDGDVKVADFGIAKTDAGEVTDVGTLKGKYEYMSPEQAEGLPVDLRSDVFSLGIVLYEALTGRRAFKTGDDAETLRRVRAAELPRPRLVDPAVPEALEAVCLRALSGDPDRRYPTARAMGEALRKAIGGVASDEEHREQLSAWMARRLDAERAADAQRLDEGTVAARALRAQVEAGGGPRPLEAPATRRRRAVAAVLGLGLAAAAVTGLAVANQVPAPPAVEVATTGSLEVRVRPAARVRLDGRDMGRGEQVRLDVLPAGSYTLKLTAADHQPHEASVRVARGGLTKVDVALRPGLGADAPEVRFESRPPGAIVLVDGEEIGRTPLAWREGLPRKRYAVVMRLEGHEDEVLTVSGLTLREVRRVSRRLLTPAEAAAEAASQAASPPSQAGRQPRAVSEVPATTTTAAPSSPRESGTGNLRVLLVGATWAHVWVDGEKLDRAAPFAAVALPAGRHRVRVENPAGGMSHEETVTIAAGQTATVRVMAQ